MVKASEILDFWYGGDRATPFAHMKKWWQKNEAFEVEIKEKFGSVVESAKKGELENWKETSEGALAFIIVLDQFSRNIFRGTPEAFAADSKALEATLRGISAGMDYKLNFAQRYFFYMPLMHAEDLARQEMSVQKFGVLAEAAPPEQKQYLEAALDYAKKHRDIIAEFGRFPHRNTVLGRPSTPIEVAFLKKPGSSF